MLPLRLPLRLAARVGRTHSRLVRQSFALSQPSGLSLHVFRTFASPGRPKKDASATATGKPKKATKSGASKKPKVKTAAKKPVKKPKKVAKPRGKVYTPEELQAKKDRAALKEKKLEIKALKETALSPPTNVHTRTFIIFHGDRTKGSKLSDGQTLAGQVKDSAQAYRDLSSQEREHWNHVTNQKNLQIEKEYKDFLESYTPDQIRLANIARRRLRVLLPASAKKYPSIRDDRLVKRPVPSYFQFSTERIRSGDFRGITPTQATKDIAAEWKALSSAEKKTYADLAAKDVERYKREHLEAYGHEVPAQSYADVE